MVKQDDEERTKKQYSLSHFHYRRRQRDIHHHHYYRTTIMGGAHSARNTSTIAAIPTAVEMERRTTHRQSILASTETHLRTYEDTIEADTSRNIVFVLLDREMRGPNHVLSLSRWRTFHHPDRTKSSVTSGARSPSTVLESPPRETSASSSSQQNNNTTNHHHHLMTEVIMEEQEETTSFTETDEIVHSSPSTITTPWPRTGVPPEQPSSLRRVSYPLSITRELQTFAEYAAAVRYRSACLNHLGGDDIIDADGNRPVSSHAVSTISICFSHDGLTVASTHGDHTVKISCCITGVLLRSLDGHPRTPWTVKYHPTHPHILASGCLGHQVRVWNWRQKQCLQMVRLEFAIISLAFHPSGTLLAIANGTKLHFWGINNTNTTTSTTATTTSSSATTARLMESDQKHMLRCVHFPPAGDTIIIGGANPMQDDPRRRRSGIGGNNGMSFYLRLWDFDLERALELPYNEIKDNNTNNIPFGITMGKRSISNPRTFVPRALLYNDGGFDVSPDGKKLCVCAEYWLPDGVDNVMEQLHHEERLYEALMRDKENGSADQPQHHKASPLPDSFQEEPHNGFSNNLLPTNLFTNIHPTNHDMPRTPGNSSPEGHSYGSSLSHDNVPVMMMNNGSFSSLLLNNSSFVPTTPPVSIEPRGHNLSPPPPPGRRPAGSGILRHARESVSIASGGQPVPHTSTAVEGDNGRAVAAGPSLSSGAMIGRYSRGTNTNTTSTTTTRGVSTPPPPPPSHAPVATTMRAPHPYSIISPATSSHYNSGPGTPSQHLFDYGANRGRYVPHIAVISIDPSPAPDSIVDGRLHTRNKSGSVARGYKPRLGQLMEAIPLDANKATAVTCVKFSPSTDFCLIGYGVRQPGPETDTGFHPVTAVYRIRGGMSHVSTMLSKDDDVNIARFHPDSGHGIVYGTKQGRVRVLSPRPWNFY